MTRQEAAELSPLIKAFGQGKDIEIRSKNPHTQLNGWAKMDEFIFGNFEYRIKPEPKYRPFKDAEECWQEMQKHQPFGWVISENGEVNSLIIFIDNEGIVIGDRNNGVIGFVTATDLFKIKFADGTPFGVKVEE